MAPPSSLPANRLFFLLWIDSHNRKNYLCAGSDSGGERAAAIYTLVRTAKLNALNPEAYLSDILTKIAEGHTINRIDELVPWRMIPAAVNAG